MNAKPLLALSALGLALALAGCAQKAEEAAAENAIEAASGGKADVDIDGDNTKVTVQTAEGTATMSSGGDVALPADFPSDVAMADDRKVVSLFTAEGATALSYTTAGALAEVVAAQSDTMKGNGWTQSMSLDADNKSSMRAYSKEGRDVVLAYTADDAGQVTVSVQLSAKK